MMFVFFGVPAGLDLFCFDEAHKSINDWRTASEYTMTIDNKHNFADAEVLSDDEYFPRDESEPVAQAIFVSTAAEVTNESKSPVVTQSIPTSSIPINNNTTSSNNTTAGGRDPDTTAHIVQHKKNVVTGVISGVLLGGILLGPIGAIAGGFIGSSIVNRRERRWQYHRHGNHYCGSHRMARRHFVERRGHCGGPRNRCHGRWY